MISLTSVRLEKASLPSSVLVNVSDWSLQIQIKCFFQNGRMLLKSR